MFSVDILSSAELEVANSATFDADDDRLADEDVARMASTALVYPAEFPQPQLAPDADGNEQAGSPQRTAELLTPTDLGPGEISDAEKAGQSSSATQSVTAVKTDQHSAPENEFNDATDHEAEPQLSFVLPDADPLHLAHRAEYVFVDAGFANSEEIIDQLQHAADAGVEWTVVELPQTGSAINLITDTLTSVSGVDAVHLLVNQTEDSLVLGDTLLDVNTVPGYSAELWAWGQSLESGAQLNLYAGRAPAGVALVNEIALNCQCGVIVIDFPAQSEVASTTLSEAAVDINAGDDVLLGSDAGDTQPRHELVLLDSSIENPDLFISDLQQTKSPHINFDVQLLDAGRGIEQIGGMLRQYPNLDALHLVTHGDDGALRIGNTVLSNQSFSAYSNEISSWGAAQYAGVDLVIYGCNLAASQNGQSLVTAIADTTGFDIASSDDVTGHRDLGGDWVFEFVVGDVNTDVAFSAGMQQSWFGSLPAPVLDNTGNMWLYNVAENTVDHAGQTVESIITSAGGDRITDVDGDPEGIAIVVADHSNGTFQFSTDTGTSWNVVPAVSANNALLLSADAKIRFIPTADYYGNAAIDFHAWDQTSGINGSTADASTTGGTTAFSTDIEQAAVQVYSTNQWPNAADDVLDTVAGQPLTITPISDLLANDRDADGDALSVWSFTQPGNGTLVDNGDGTMTYTPDAGYEGDDYFDYTVSDQEAINDASVLLQGQGEWAVSGSTIVDEGDTAAYTISYSGLRSASVDVSLTDVQTDSSDYGDFVAAVNSAVSAHSDLSFDGTTLSYTAPEMYSIAYDTSASNFNDISATGTVVSLNDDSYSLQNIGFDFEFFRHTYTDLFVGSNGFVSFRAGSLWLNNVELTTGNELTDLPAIFAFWDDLNPAAAGSDNVYTQTLGTAGNQQFIIQFNDVQRFSATADGTVTFQIVLFEGTNEIELRYEDSTFDGTVFDDAVQATIGIVDGHSLALQHSFDTASITSGSHIRLAVTVQQMTDLVVNLDILNDADAELDEDLLVALSNPISSFLAANSSVTTEIDGNNPVTGSPVINGTIAEDETLTADTSALADDEGLGAFSYQWYRDGAEIIGATAVSYTTGDADVGTLMSVAVSFSDGQGNPESASSAQAGPVAGVNDAPVITVVGSSGGTAAEGGAAASLLNDSLTDIDSTDFDGGTLTVTVTSTPDPAGHTLNIINVGDVSVNGNDILVDGILVGNAGGSSGTTGPLVVTFNSDATLARVEKVYRAFAIFNTSEDPAVGLRTLTAVITDGDGGTSNVSTKSVNFTATNDEPVWANLSGTVTYNEPSNAVFVNPLITVTDVDSGDFDGGQLTAQISANVSNDDWLRIVPDGNVELMGSDVVVGGVVIGTHIGGHGSADLIISLNASADAANVSELARQIAYANTSDAPTPANRTVSFTLTDGDGGTSSAASNTVAVNAVNDVPVARDDIATLDFDGVGDYVALSDDPALNLPDTFALEMWFRAESFPAVSPAMLINKEGEYEIGISDGGEIRWTIANTDPGWVWHRTGYTITTGAWTHVALTYDNGVASTYVNGTLVDQYYGRGSLGDAHPSMNELRIGGRTNTADFFDGQIDDVRIWNVARSEAEIQSLLDSPVAANASGLVLNLVFNEQTGIITADTSVNGFIPKLSNDIGGTGPLWLGYSVLANGELDPNAAPGVLSNDIDFDADSLSVSAVNTSTTLGNATINAAGEIGYSPNGAFDYLADGEVAYDFVAYSADDGNGAEGSAKVRIVVTGVNDAPLLDAGGTHILSAIDEDTSGTNGNSVAGIIASAGGVGITDVDNGSVAGVGVYNADTANGSWEYSLDNGTSWLSFGNPTSSGVLLLNESARIRFEPVADFNGNATVGFVAWDQTVGVAGAVLPLAGNIGGTGTFSSSSNTATAIVNPVNDAPTLDLDNDDSSGTAGLDFTTSYSAGSAPVAIVDGSAVGDIDSTLSSLTVDITNADALLSDEVGYTLPANISVGVVENSVWTFTNNGSATNADFQSLLESLTYHSTSTTFASGNKVIEIFADDGDQLSAVATATVALTADTSAPVLVANSGSAVDEAGIDTITSSELRYTDIQPAASVNYTLTTTTANGYLALASDTSVAISAFTQPDIDSANLVYLHNGSETTMDTFTFSVADGLGNALSGQVFNLAVAAQNDAPVNSVASNQAVNEDTALQFSAVNGNAITISDDDGGEHEISLSVASGLLTLFTVSDLSFTIGDGNADTALRFRGSTAAINAALDGLTYQPDPNYHGTDSLIVLTDDLGNSGTGGALSDLDPVQISISSVNDLPGTGTSSSSSSEDVGLVFVTLGGYDLDGIITHFRVKNLPDNGWLYKDSGRTQFVIPGEDIAVTTGSTQRVYFVPDENWFGTTTFEFAAKDNDGGYDLTPSTATINISAVNDPPDLLNNGAEVQEGESDLVITPAMLSGSDVDDTASELTFRLTSQPAQGELFFNDGSAAGALLVTGSTFTQTDLEDGSLYYNHKGGEQPTDEFGLELYDGGENSAPVRSGTFVFTVLAQNDAPVLADVEPDALLYTENQGAVVVTSTSTVVDNDNTQLAGAGVTIDGYVENEDRLVFTDTGTIVSTWDSTTGVLALEGLDTTAAYLQALHNVGYINDSDQPSTAARSITMQVDDGVSLSNVVSRGLMVTAVNDDPVNSGSLILSQSIDEDTPGNIDLSTVQLADADAGNDSLIVTLSTTNGGTLSYANTATLAIAGSGSSSIVLAGPLVELNDWLQGSGNLVYAPVGQINGTAVDAIEIRVNDNGSGGNGGGSDQSIGSISIDVAEMNDEPSGADTVISIDEDENYTLVQSDFGFSDPADAHNFHSIVVAQLPTNGSLFLDNVLVVADDTVSVDQINGGLLRYTPPVNAHGTALDVLHFQVQDDGGMVGINRDATANTITFDVTGINDPPVGMDLLLTTPEDTPVPITVEYFGFSDSADADQLRHVIIESLPANGVLTINGTEVAAEQHIAASIIEAGELVYTPQAQAYGIAFEQILFRLVDDGAPGTNTSIELNRLSIDVSPVNDPPAGLDAAITTQEDQPYVFEADEFGFSDPNDPADRLQGVLISNTPDTGVLSVDGELVKFGDVVAAADIEAGRFQYQPPADASADALTEFLFRVQDNNSQAGQNTDLIAREMIINVFPVSDAPAGSNNLVEITEDTEYVFPLSEFGFADVLDGDSLESVLIEQLPVQGQLLLDETPVLVTNAISVADIAAGLLKYKPGENYHGADQLTFRLQDDGANPDRNTGIVDNTSESYLFEVSVNAVSDAPAGTDKIISVLEDTVYAFTRDDFGFSDNADVQENHQFTGITLSSLPDSGLLSLAGSAVNQNQFITLSELESGNLTYTPAVNANGMGLLGFSFQVHDSGSTDSLGVNIDQTANFIGFDLPGVNDAPVLVTNGATVAEGGTTVISSEMLYGLDADDPAPGELNLTITSLPQHGELRLAGLPVSVGDNFTLQSIFDEALSYLHDESETSQDSFAVTLTDGGEDGTQAASGEFSLTITEVIDPPPEIDNDQVSLKFGEAFDSLSGDLLDSGYAGLSKGGLLQSHLFTVEMEEQPAHGTVELNSDGTFVYVHDDSPNLSDSFRYRVTNEDGVYTIATVNITIEPPLQAANELVVVNQPNLSIEQGDSGEDNEEQKVTRAQTPDSNAYSEYFLGALAETPMENMDTSDGAGIVEIANVAYSTGSSLSRIADYLDLSVQQHKDVEQNQLVDDSLQISQFAVDLVLEVKQPSTPRETISNEAFLHGLSRLDDDLSEADSRSDRRFDSVGEALLGVSISVTAGTLMWVFRGGALFGSLMTLTPLWNSFDITKIPVSGSGRSRDGERDESSQVEDIFEGTK